MRLLTTTPTRTPLPPRRMSETRTICTGKDSVDLTLGRDPATGQVLEVFFNGKREGSEIANLLHDAGVLLSLALQHRIPAAVMAKSIARDAAEPMTPEDLENPDLATVPATLIEAALDVLATVEETA